MATSDDCAPAARDHYLTVVSRLYRRRQWWFERLAGATTADAYTRARDGIGHCESLIVWVETRCLADGLSANAREPEPPSVANVSDPIAFHPDCLLGKTGVRGGSLSGSRLGSDDAGG